MNAPDILAQAKQHMDNRAATYDKPEGERSMERTVQAFNIITGRAGDASLSESEGWLLMQILKDVRDRQRKNAHQDSLEDCVAYSALKAEARIKEARQTRVLVGAMSSSGVTGLQGLGYFVNAQQRSV